MTTPSGFKFEYSGQKDIDDVFVRASALQDAFAVGGLYTWGYNGYGILGDGTTVSKSSPVQVGSLSNWKSVSTTAHAMAIKTDGTLWAWGNNGGYGGQLGDGTMNPKSSPIQIGNLTNWSKVSTGYQHTVAVKTDGTLWTWGMNLYGQLGTNTHVLSHTSVPGQVGVLTNWKTVATQGSYNLAIKTDGTLWAWGYNYYGDMGDGTSGSAASKSSPVQIGSLTDWVKISCGSDHSAAIKADGTLWMWGLNMFGQVGDGTILDRSSPVQIGSLTNWSSISCGAYFTTAIKTDGTLWTWGYNPNGELGDGTRVSKSSPVQVGSLNNWAQTAGSGYGFIARKTDGTLWTCGYNGYGDLGDGTRVSKSSPVQVGSLNTWVFVSVQGSIRY